MKTEKNYYVEDFITKYVKGKCIYCGTEVTYQMYTVEDDKVVYCYKCGKRMKTKVV